MSKLSIAVRQDVALDKLQTLLNDLKRDCTLG